MPFIRSIDIDSLDDFKIVNLLIKKMMHKKFTQNNIGH